MIYWQPSAVREWAPSESLDRAFALKVTRLLRELIFAAFEANAATRKAELAVRLILHELTETPDAPTFLPLPESAIGRRVAELALADSRCRLDIGEIASRATTSVRTISRVFPVETGLTYIALATKGQDCPCDRRSVRRKLNLSGGRQCRFRQLGGILLRVPASDQNDPRHVSGHATRRLEMIQPVPPA